MDASGDGPGVLDRRGDSSDVTSPDSDGGFSPGPTDAASEDGSGPVTADGANDADAAPDTSGADANGADGAADVAGDAAPAADATSDNADAVDSAVDVAGDAASTADATGNTDAADSAPDAMASGFPGSALVDSSQGAMINGWIGTPAQLWKLCYSTALHTRSGVTFHTNCDFKGPSVSIARVSYSTETRIIGGYNSGSWTSPVTPAYANNAGSFLFSVTNAFQHSFPGSSTVPYYTLNNANYGPTFGAGTDWYVHSQLTMGTCRPGYTYQCRVGTVDSATCNADFCGTPTSSDYYTLEALEVWVK
jgi:hypothetical protein